MATVDGGIVSVQFVAHNLRHNHCLVVLVKDTHLEQSTDSLMASEFGIGTIIVSENLMKNHMGIIWEYDVYYDVIMNYMISPLMFWVVQSISDDC